MGNGLRTLQAEAQRLERKCVEKVEAALKADPVQHQSLSSSRSAFSMDLGVDYQSGGMQKYGMKAHGQQKSAKNWERSQTPDGIDHTALGWCFAPRPLDRAARGCQSLPHLV